MKNERQLSFRDIRPDSANHIANLSNDRHPISLLLDNVNDVRNIGGLFRLGDAARLSHIYIYKNDAITLNTKSKRISRNTIELIPHSFINSIDEVVELSKTHQLTALEHTTHSILYTAFTPKKDLLLVIGNEQHGVSDELLDLVTDSIHLPMYGLKSSMNVMCAASVAVYGLLERLR